MDRVRSSPCIRSWHMVGAYYSTKPLYTHGGVHSLGQSTLASFYKPILPHNPKKTGQNVFLLRQGAQTQTASCAGASQVAKYDDLIEEASGELDQVEGQLYSATQQLLDLQGRLSQLTQEAHAADKTKLRVKPCLSLFASNCCR